MNKDKQNQKHYLFWNIMQKLAIVTFAGCVVYFFVSSGLFLTTMSIKNIESMWGPERFLPHTLLILIGAVSSLVMIFISTKLKNKN